MMAESLAERYTRIVRQEERLADAARKVRPIAMEALVEALAIARQGVIDPERLGPLATATVVRDPWPEGEEMLRRWPVVTKLKTWKGEDEWALLGLAVVSARKYSYVVLDQYATAADMTIRRLLSRAGVPKEAIEDIIAIGASPRPCSQCGTWTSWDKCPACGEWIEC